MDISILNYINMWIEVPHFSFLVDGQRYTMKVSKLNASWYICRRKLGTKISNSLPKSSCLR